MNTAGSKPYSLGTAAEKPDAVAKMNGEALYGADLHLPGMLTALPLLSTIPRGRILSLELPPLPPGYWVIDKEAVPGINRTEIVNDDWPLFADDEIRFFGQTILLICGPDPAVIEGLLRECRVGYDQEPAVETITEALLSPAPFAGDDNVFLEYNIQKGDPDGAMETANRIFKGEYSTGFQEQAYMEPQAMVARYEEGKLTIQGSMQCPYYIKNALQPITGLPPDKIRVIRSAVGGAFGGKEDFPSVIAGYTAVAAMHCGKPVRMVLDRRRDMMMTPKRHPSFVTIRTALDDNDAILALSVDLKLDGGAYLTLSPVVLQRAIFAAAGIYDFAHVHVRGQVIATNHVPSGAFRGFGAPQAFFAIERHMDRLADYLGIEQLALKRRYLPRQGALTLTGGKHRFPIPFPAMLERLEAMSGYSAKRRRYGKGSPGTTLRKGIGLALFFHGCGFTGSGERDLIKGRIRLTRREDGDYAIEAAGVDMGQGAETTLAKVVAAVTGATLDRIHYCLPDTDTVPDSGPTVASRTAMIVGALLYQAAEELMTDENQEKALTVEKRYKHPDYLSWDGDSFRGDAYPVFSWGVNAVEVTVDTVTGEISVTGCWGVYDTGAALDERILRGQLQGGFAQSLGWALQEVLESREGQLQQASFTDYAIPGTKDFPDLQIALMDNPYPLGPFGAKGAGELPNIGPAPALAAAVENAMGIGITRVPVTPEDLEDLRGQQL